MLAASVSAFAGVHDDDVQKTIGRDKTRIITASEWNMRASVAAAESDERRRRTTSERENVYACTITYV